MGVWYALGRLGSEDGSLTYFVCMALMFPDSLAVLSTTGLLPSYNALDKMH